MIAIYMPAIICVEGHQTNELVGVRLFIIVWALALTGFKFDPDGRRVDLFPFGYVVAKNAGNIR